ncbi:MAG TPA: carboxypeptidase-like regulatory domain-containing protein [Gemmatimonadaceae bacterium]|nr:carboxypeptidase-like regulatory domain-containing protein [Gemmatimonadaceae bacterium]
MTRWQRTTGRALLGLLGCACPLLAPAQAAQQASIRGQVNADSSGTPVSGAEVSVVEISRTVRSSAAGEFAFDDLQPGLYLLRVRYPGFTPLEDTVRAVAGETVRVRYRITRIAVALTPVTVVADSVVELSALMADFRRRRETANGKFLTAAEIRKIGSQSLVSLVRGHVGGFDLVRHPSGMGTAFASRRAAAPKSFERGARPGNECYSSVWINGQLIYTSSPGKLQDPPRIEDFDVTHLNGLEFYRSAAETPLEFNAMTAACGTVVIWMDLR